MQVASFNEKKHILQMRLIIILLLSLIVVSNTYSQGCCSGGSGSPIGGGASQGVLQDRQMEIASSYQYLSSDKFKTENRDTAKLFEKYYSKYIYSKIAYGVTKDFTVSAELGYFLNKTEVRLFDSVLNKSEEVQSSGIADLIIFP